ncbi:LDCC motif putative metal-binding protein [Haliovirga abyssi]|uniref:Bacteriocin n=1 Tax=Haliovirga abyssi TaxID=2996794 RepID=A0AAU9DNR4_9FUSO|nr:LDCC motif putative metal-binding protein [Haliovirga abyssi]BDU51717.1 hypothetical protein HLVA_22860 [Haliovirga abyssi]
MKIKEIINRKVLNLLKYLGSENNKNLGTEKLDCCNMNKEEGNENGSKGKKRGCR